MRSGFTLIETVVVVLIVGVVTAVAIPRYTTMSETTKADGATSLTKQIGLANISYALDHNGASTSGTIDNSCNRAVCQNITPAPACNLVACGYLAKTDWDGTGYFFRAISDPTSNPVYVSCAARSTDSATFSTWEFFARPNGMVDSKAGSCWHPRPCTAGQERSEIPPAAASRLIAVDGI